MNRLPAVEQADAQAMTGRDPIGAALKYLTSQQDNEGCWKGDYSGPLFLLPSLVMTRYVIGYLWDDSQKTAIGDYLFRHQNSDGGWGLHIEDQSRLYTTVLNYVALRLIGHDPNDSRLTPARHWIGSHGGATRMPQWGKFLLAILNLYDYRGLLPTPPEMWQLPRWLPIHPSRFWCHSRMVLLPMTYLYGRRAQLPLDELTRSLREEIFDRPYEKIRWSASMFDVAETDTYQPFSRSLRTAGRVLKLIERFIPKRLRQHALTHVLDHVDQEDRNTHYICLGPINKLLNTLCWHFAEPGGEEVANHRTRLNDYLSSDQEGLRMNGYNSSQLWDTAFAVQAICATDRVPSYAMAIQKAVDFIDRQQVRDDVPDYQLYHRHQSRGGWPFSDLNHGWPISDCTALGLEAMLNVSSLLPSAQLDSAEARFTEAVELILSLQNKDGGWATYERTRGSSWLEKLNATSLFADVMIDYSYVECTSACLQGLARYRLAYPKVLNAPIDRAIQRGRGFLLRKQRKDGSWYGSWGVCFTYGTWFGVWGLRAAGLAADHPAVEAAARFLSKHQLPDGGWGETIQSCKQQTYQTTASGQAVMTAWAILTLARTGYAESPEVERAVKFLTQTQIADGSWPKERIAGVFNRSCAIHYDNYLRVFPLWALAEANRNA